MQNLETHTDPYSCLSASPQQMSESRKTKPGSKSRALERSDNENKTTLTPSTAADESEIVEFGHLILYHRCGVSHLSTKVFVVARSHGH